MIIYYCVRNGGLTLEEQRAFMAQVKMPAGEEVVKGESEEAASSCLRNVPLGRDRDGRLVWKLETAAHLTGCGLSHNFMKQRKAYIPIDSLLIIKFATLQCYIANT